MADVLNFTGLGISVNTNIPQRDCTGISVADLSNFVVEVIDNLGTPVQGATVTFTIGGVNYTETTGSDGAVAVQFGGGKYPAQANVILLWASLDCLESERVPSSYTGVPPFVRVTLVIGELPCIEPDPINQDNFILWNIGDNLSFPADGCPSICTSCDESEIISQSDVSNAYEPLGGQKSYAAFTTGETYHFVLNAEIIQSIIAESDGRGAIVDDQYNVVIAEAGTVALTPISLDGYQFIYGSFRADQALYPKGLYRLMIYNKDTGRRLADSNLLRYYPAYDLSGTSYYCYRDSGRYKNYPYDVLPEGWTNGVRLESSFINPVVGSESEVYRELSTGQRDPLDTDFDFAYTVEFPLIDSRYLKALDVALRHESLEVNGAQYVRQSGPEGDTDAKGSRVKTVTASLWLQEYSTNYLNGA